MAFNAPLTIGTKSYERQTPTQFIEAGSTITVPDLLIIQNRNLLNNNGKPSQVTVKFDVSKDSAVAGAPDYRLQFWTTVQFIPGQFSQAEIEVYRDRMAAFLTNSNLTKLLRGET